MMAKFRNIDYGRMLYESLRNYFSINANGDVSIAFQFLACFLAVLQQPFNDYDAFRVRQALIASCKWQIGQLTNVLNFLFDSLLKRIFITQSVISVVADPMFEYDPVNFDSDFDTLPPMVFEVEFGDRVSETLVTINVPVGVDLPSLTAVVNQIRLQGIPYRIVTF